MRKSNRPFFVGVGGGSASGKTTIVLGLKKALAPLSVQVIHQDHFYKRGEGIPKYYSPSLKGWFGDYNHRRSFRWDELIRFCRRVSGTDVVFLEGLLALHRPELRRLMDMRIFIACPAGERLRRRLLRGVSGWDKARHRRYWAECVEPGFRRYVNPTRRYAQVIVRNDRRSAPARRKALGRLRAVIRLGVRNGDSRSGRSRRQEKARR